MACEQIQKMQAGHKAAEGSLRQEIQRLRQAIQRLQQRHEDEIALQVGHKTAASSQQLHESPVNGINAEVSSEASRPRSRGRGARALSMLSNVLKIPSASSPLRPDQQRLQATGNADAADNGRPSDEVESMRLLNKQLATMLVERSPPNANGTNRAGVQQQAFNDEGARKLEQVQMQQVLRATSHVLKNPAATEPRPTYYVSSRGPSPRRGRPPRGVD